MSLSGLHSMEIYANEIIVAGVTYLVSLCCHEKYVLIMFEKYLCCLFV